MNITISFDMDGTLNQMYLLPNWLEMLINEDTTPYEIAKPTINFSLLARYLNKLQKYGYNLQVVSWLSKNGTEKYNQAVTIAKLQWLKKHLPSVVWNDIQILPYGTPKEKYCYTTDDVLFDDEELNRIKWTGIAFDEKNILKNLKKILDNSEKI